jgi:hypothetical protein
MPQKKSPITCISLVFYVLVLIFGIMANSCHVTGTYSDNSSQVLINKEDAARKIIDVIVPNIGSINLTVHQYPTLLDAGSKVTQARAYGSNALDNLFCEHSSWLFFFDLAPGSHFAHPTRLALMDATNGEIKSIDTEWWPVIEVPIFDSVKEREDQNAIVFER